MFRKALITIAAAVSLSSAAFAQFNPNEPAYIRANGPQAAAEYNRDDNGYAQQGTGYNPRTQNGPQVGGYGPQGGGYGQQSGGYAPQAGPQGGYGPQNGGYGPQNQGGYGPQSGGPQAGNYGPQGQGGYAPQQQQQQPASSIDMRSVAPGQSRLYRYMMPQGWRPIESEGMCLIASPDMTMAYGLMAPGTVQGTVSADAYMKDTLTRVAQFQNVQILNGQRGQVRAPFTESGCFLITYTSGGAQYVGMITCAVAQTANGTYGFLQLVIGTQQALQANGQPLMQLLQSVTPLNPPQAPQTTGNGPVNNGPNYGPVSNGPTNPNPSYQPAGYPTPNGNPSTANPLER